MNGVREAFSLDAVKAWILEGDYPKAESALARRLKKEPSDTASRMLLATCYSKSGAYENAVRSLQTAIETGTPAEQNRARFKAAQLYREKLGRNDEAVRMLDAYLKTTPGLRPNTLEAKVRLARSLFDLGDRTRGRTVLHDIIEHHGGTEAAADAKQQLDRLDGNTEPKAR